MLLAGFVIGVPLALFGPSLLRTWQGPPEPLWRAVDAVPVKPVQIGVTRGMTVSDRGFGTVDAAPAVVTAMSGSPPVSDPDTRPAADVAPFVAAWARLERTERETDPVFTCNLIERLPARGRVVLRDGCLKVAFGGSPEQPLLPLNARLFRDADGYLALGVKAGAADRSVRVGEPDASILVASCPVPGSVAPPPAYARACGSEPMVVAAQVGRRPVCSARFLVEREQKERAEAAAAVRIKAEADACKTAGRKTCPPGVIPRMPPLTDETAPCRLPAGYRSSQGSSTQP